MARFLSSGGRVPTRPQQKKDVTRPAGPREPRRGSRDGLGMAPKLPLGGHYGVKMAREVAKMISGFFGNQFDPNLGSSWAPLGSPRGPKMQYV